MKEQDERDVPRRRWITVLLLADGALGFAIGAVLLPTMQIALEPAQALAGLVRYPWWNPQYQYELRTWSLLNQLPALALSAGMSEVSVSIIISGLAGSLSCAAIALLVYAVVPSRPFLAILAPFVVAFAKGSSFEGVTYMVKLFGSEATYGMVGLSFFMLVAALLACKELRWGAALAAVAPAVHPSLGVWLALALLVTIAIQRQSFVRAFRDHWQYWSAGAVVTAASLVAHRLSAPRVPADHEVGEYLAVFIRLWDAHRKPFSIATVPIAEVACAVVAAVVLWRKARRSAAEGQATLAVLILSTVLMGAVGSVAYWLPPERVPAFLLAIMPSRLLNVALFAALPLLIALLASHPGTGDRDSMLFLLGALGTPAVVRVSWLLGEWPILDKLAPGWRAATQNRVLLTLQVIALGVILWRAVPVRRRKAVLLGGAVVALCMAVVLLSGRSVDPVVAGRYSVARLIAAAGAVAVAILIFARRTRWRPFESTGNPTLYGRLAIVVATISAALFVMHHPPSCSSLTDRTNDDFWRLVASRPGMVLPGPGLRMIQLRTRRPVLLATESLDYLPFTPGVGPAMDLILRRVYGVDLFKPPESVRRERLGGLPRGENRVYFERRSRAEWTSLRRRFGITDVVCEKEWNLQLPRIATGHGLALYAIPDVTTPAVTR